MKLVLTVAPLLLAATAVQAATLKQVPATLDPTKAYVLVEYKLTPNPWASAPLSRNYMPLLGGLTLGRYDPALRDIRGLGRAAASKLPDDKSPSEPFRDRPIVKTEGARLFLMEVEPDTWVVQGWGGTSFSLGSYMFEARPGTVTDLGVVEGAVDWPDGEAPKAPSVGGLFVEALKGPFAKQPTVAPARVTFRPRGSSDIPLPAALPIEQVQAVEFQPGATFGNYLGALVNRIEGVNASRKTPAAASMPSTN